MAPRKAPVSSTFVRDSDDSDDEYFPDQYGNVQVCDPTHVRKGMKPKKINMADNPEDNNPVTSLLTNVSDARIGYFKVCLADNNFFGQGPQIERHRLNRREVTKDSLMELRRALGGNTQDPKAPFTRIARYVPLYAVILIIDPTFIDLDSVVQDPGNLLSPGDFQHAVWTADSIEETVWLANGTHRYTVISELSKEHLKRWKEAMAQLAEIPLNDTRGRSQKANQIRQLELEMEERSSWLAVAYDINKMTPEIELFLSTNAHHYQESDTEQDRLHMALEYVYNKPEDERVQVIQQAKAPGGWPIPYPMPPRLKAAFDEVNLINKLVEAYPYIKLWRGYELNPTSISSWKGSPSPFMEQLLYQGTFILNFLTSTINLKDKFSVSSTADMEAVRASLYAKPPKPVPNVLDENFFVVVTAAYKEYLHPVRELFAVSATQIKDLDKWTAAYEAYGINLLDRLRAWADERRRELDRDDQIAHESLVSFSRRLRWVLSGLFNDYRFGMLISGMSPPLPCGMFLASTAKGLTTFSSWLDLVFQWIEPFYRFPFAMHQSSATSHLLLESLSSFSNDEEGLELCYRRLLTAIFSHRMVAITSMWNVDGQAAPLPLTRSFGISKMAATDPDGDWTAEYENVLTVLKSWRIGKGPAVQFPLLVKELSREDRQLLGSGNHAFFIPLFEKTAVAWADCGNSNLVNHMKAVAVHLMRILWLAEKHYPRYQAQPSFSQLRKAMARAIEDFTQQKWMFWDGLGLNAPPMTTDTANAEQPSSQVIKFTPRVHLAHQSKANAILNETRAAVMQIIKLVSSTGVGAIPGSERLPEALPYEDVYTAAKILFEKIAIASHRAQTIYTEPLKERMFEVPLQELEVLYHALNVPSSFRPAKPADVLAYYTPMTYEQLDEVEAITDTALAMKKRAEIRQAVKAEKKRQTASRITSRGAASKEASTSKSTPDTSASKKKELSASSSRRSENSLSSASKKDPSTSVSSGPLVSHGLESGVSRKDTSGSFKQSREQISTTRAQQQAEELENNPAQPVKRSRSSRDDYSRSASKPEKPLAEGVQDKGKQRAIDESQPPSLAKNHHVGMNRHEHSFKISEDEVARMSKKRKHQMSPDLQVTHQTPTGSTSRVAAMPTAPKRSKTGMLTVSQSSSNLGTVLVPPSSSPDIPISQRIPDEVLNALDLFGDEPVENMDENSEDEPSAPQENGSPSVSGSEEEVESPGASSASPSPPPPQSLPQGVTRTKDGKLFFNGQ